jgi:octaprenyl-diphosphate synthase
MVLDTADIETIRARHDTKAPVADVNDLVRLSAADMDDVNALIRDRMQSDVAIIPALADHLIAAGGKRLRPLLCVAAARLCDTANTHHHNLSAAVEFIHTATLLHDDVVDSSNLRRGKVAAHLIWGAPSSVLVGDFLFSRAFELMVETGSLEALGILSKASAVIAEGEVWQLTKAFDINLSIDTYIEIISAKTAALFAAASESGAVSAKATPEQREALRLYGLYLGLAFQIQDDALDYTGSAADLGKNAGDDFAEGKATLPLLLAVQRSKDTHADFWHRAVSLRQQADGDLHTAQQIMNDTDALVDAIAMARDYAAQAKACLSAFKSSAWKTALENLVDYSVARQK